MRQPAPGRRIGPGRRLLVRGGRVAVVIDVPPPEAKVALTGSSLVTTTCPVAGLGLVVVFGLVSHGIPSVTGLVIQPV